MNRITGNWLRLKLLTPIRKVRHRKLRRPHAPGDEARARGGNFILGSFLITVQALSMILIAQEIGLRIAMF